MFRDSTHLHVRHPTTQKSVTLKLWLSKRRYDATGLVNSRFHNFTPASWLRSPHNTELQWNICSKQPWFICIQQATRPKHNKRLAVTPKGSQNFFFLTSDCNVCPSSCCSCSLLPECRAVQSCECVSLLLRTSLSANNERQSLSKKKKS